MNRLAFFSLTVLAVLAGVMLAPPDFFSAPQEMAAGADNAQRWVFMLQYIASDYERAVQNGRIVDDFEYQEMQRFAHSLLASYQTSRESKKSTQQELQKLKRLIDEQVPVRQIRAQCQALLAVLIKEKDLLVFPRFGPDVGNGERLFDENCVPCHGPRGAGNGPAADTLNPKPRDFTDPDRLNQYAPYQLFQAISFGVEGTAMASFAEAFTADERWDLAFYVMTLRRDFNALPAAEQQFTLQQLATQNNHELLALLRRQKLPHSASELPALVDYCRNNPPQPTNEEYIAITERLLKQSLAAYVRGDSALANQLSYDAYWQGFELIERHLQFPLYRRFESIFGDYNVCLEMHGQEKQAREHMRLMLEILQHIRKGRGWRTAMN